jgi:hypothetical protein
VLKPAERHRPGRRAPTAREGSCRKVPRPDRETPRVVLSPRPRGPARDPEEPGTQCDLTCRQNAAIAPKLRGGHCGAGSSALPGPSLPVPGSVPAALPSANVGCEAHVPAGMRARSSYPRWLRSPELLSAALFCLRGHGVSLPLLEVLARTALLPPTTSTLRSTGARSRRLLGCPPAGAQALPEALSMDPAPGKHTAVLLFENLCST